MLSLYRLMRLQPREETTILDHDLFNQYPDLFSLAASKLPGYFEARTMEVPRYLTAHSRWVWIAEQVLIRTGRAPVVFAPQEITVPGTHFSWRFVYACDGREEWDDWTRAIYVCFELGILSYQPHTGQFLLCARSYFQCKMNASIGALTLTDDEAHVFGSIKLFSSNLIEDQLTDYSLSPFHQLSCRTGRLINCFVRARCVSECFAPEAGISSTCLDPRLEDDLLARLTVAPHPGSALTRKALYWMSYGRLSYSAVQRRFILLPLHVWKCAELIADRFRAPAIYMDHVDLVLHTTVATARYGQPGYPSATRTSYARADRHRCTVLHRLAVDLPGVLARIDNNLSVEAVFASLNINARGERVAFERAAAWQADLVEGAYAYVTLLVCAALDYRQLPQDATSGARVMLKNAFVASIVVRIMLSVTEGAACVPASMYRNLTCELRTLITARPMNPWALKAWAHFY
jgi:hypothetical protein